MKSLNMPRHFSLVVLALFSATLSYFVSRYFIAPGNFVRAAGSIQPFTLRTELYDYASHPAPFLFETETLARRSDGTTVDIRTIGPVSNGVYERTITYLDGGEVKLQDALKLKTTWPPKFEEASTLNRNNLVNPPPNCDFPGGIFLGKRDSVLGHPVAVDRWTTVDGSQSTDWRAPDLGCVSFQYVLEKRQPDGSYKLSTKEKPVSLQLGEPDQRLFEIGAEYAEVHPSEAFGKVLALLGKTPRPETAERDKNQDQLYDRLWAAHPGWTPSE